MPLIPQGAGEAERIEQKGDYGGNMRDDVAQKSNAGRSSSGHASHETAANEHESNVRSWFRERYLGLRLQ